MLFALGILFVSVFINVPIKLNPVKESLVNYGMCSWKTTSKQDRLICRFLLTNSIYCQFLMVITYAKDTNNCMTSRKYSVSPNVQQGKEKT
jgi:hypothetical protein